MSHQIKVQVYLNETHDDVFFKFDPSHSALRLAVAFYRYHDFIPSGGPATRALLEEIFTQLNVGGDLYPAEFWTQLYREQANRSLSISDVVVFHVEGQLYAFALQPAGWEEIVPGTVLLAAQRYSPEEDDRLTSLPYVWTKDGFIDVAATEALRKEQS